MQHSGPNVVASAIMILLWLAMTGGLLVAWILLIVAAWRGMKAHESIAESLKRIAARGDQSKAP